MAERVTPVEIEKEMRQSYLDYAMSVIVSRALPDARDGLKPVQRRIIYAMGDMGLWHDTPFRKSARIVGEVLGKYHPHGETAVYEAMVRMAQDFSLRYPLVDGQGNFGSIDGDGAAATRYTEARLAATARELLLDIDRDTVDYSPNFDESLQEPEVLPARLPNLLVNGSSGIAVGMSTNIPPHNLSEVCDALVYLLDQYDRVDEVDVEDLMRFIAGPDFPTGGILYAGATSAEGDNPLLRAYATGRGQVRLRAKVSLEEGARGAGKIIVSELPYQVNKSRLIERIADLVRSERLEGVTDVRDESDREGMRLVIETGRGADDREVLANLYRLTPMESTFSIILLALVGGEPRTCSLKRLLTEYVEHRLTVTRRRSEYDLARARDREHVLAGLLVALDNIDEVIDTIRRSRNADTARNNLRRRFSLSERQAQAILEMQLRRLASMERRRLEDEHEECLLTIADLEELLADPSKMRSRIKEEVLALKKEFGDQRRTQIVLESPDNQVLTAADLLPDQEVLILGDAGNRLSYQVPARKPRLPAGVTLVCRANLKDRVGLLTEAGNMMVLPVHRLPAGAPGDSPPVSDGVGGSGSSIVALVPLAAESGETPLLLATAQGKVKRVEWAAVNSAWTPVIRLDDGDRLVAGVLAGEEDSVILLSSAGQAIAFEAAQARVMGLPAGGVAGMRLGDGERVVGATRMEGQHLALLSAEGYMKKVTLRGWRTQNRGGAGIVALAAGGSVGELVAGVTVSKGENLLLAGEKGTAEVIAGDDLPVMGRSTRGRPLAKLKRRERARSLQPIS